MAGTNERYSVGNLIAVVLTMFFSAGMAWYAIWGEPTGRIGRSWQFVAAFGVLGVLILGRALITGIRSRRR